MLKPSCCDIRVVQPRPRTTRPSLGIHPVEWYTHVYLRMDEPFCSRFTLLFFLSLLRLSPTWRTQYQTLTSQCAPSLFSTLSLPLHPPLLGGLLLTGPSVHSDGLAQSWPVRSRGLLEMHWPSSLRRGVILVSFIFVKVCVWYPIHGKFGVIKRGRGEFLEPLK